MYGVYDPSDCMASMHQKLINALGPRATKYYMCVCWLCVCLDVLLISCGLLLLLLLLVVLVFVLLLVLVACWLLVVG